MNKPRRTFQAVHGTLLLDKPRGLSSNAALQQARRLLAAEKAGHTGTLDPAAEGLLVLTFGEATKLSGYLLDADKRYLAEVRFGITTTTGDGEGEVLTRVAAHVTAAQLQAVVTRFTGDIDQIPPMYSALKVAGRPLYAYARKQEVVERQSRRVRIHHISVIESDETSAKLDVGCSKGTYIRTLVEDIGAALGCGAHLSALRRTGVGGWDVGGAVTLDTLANLGPEQRLERLMPCDLLVQHLQRIDLEAQDARRFRMGQAVTSPHPFEPGAVSRVYAGGLFLGLAVQVEADALRARRLLNLSPADGDGPANDAGAALEVQA